jgi:predicted O-methyltransferase YrrM
LSTYGEKGLVALFKVSISYILLQIPIIGKHFAIIRRLHFENHAGKEDNFSKTRSIGVIARYIIGVILSDRLSLYLSIKELQRLMEEEETREDVLNTVAKFGGWGRYTSIKTMQYREELSDLLQILEKENPRTILEIGEARGGSAYTFCRSLNCEKYIGVDLPDLHDIKLTRDKKELLDLTATQTVHVRGNSHEESTVNRVKESLGNEGVDFLFIDGDHSYEGVKKDFELYSKLVCEGGIIAFDDIRHSEGVEKFWNEVKRDYKSETLVFYGESAGTGVLYL